MTQYYGLNFDALEIYECGAMLVSLLAYPEEHESDKIRGNLHATLCALALRARFDESSPDWNKPQLMKPAYAFRDESQTNKDLKTLKRRLHHRMVAARMVIPFLQEVDLGHTPELPKDLKRLSINTLSEFVLEDAKQTTPANVGTRIWRPSLPVIHIAAATAVIIDMALKAGQGPITIGHLVGCRPVIEAIVREAERYENFLPQSKKLNIEPDKLIRLRLV